MARKRLVDHLAQMLHRLAEDLAPLHPQIAGAARSRTGRHRHRECRTGGRRNADGSTGCRGLAAGSSDTAFSTQRAGAVAEQHAGAAILPVEDAREGLGADHQRGARLAEAQRVVGDRQREDEAGAHRLHVEGGAARHAEPRLDLGRGRREGVVGGRGREHDQVEIAAAHARRAPAPAAPRDTRDRRSARRRPRCGARRCRCAGGSIRPRYRGASASSSLVTMRSGR